MAMYNIGVLILIFLLAIVISFFNRTIKNEKKKVFCSKLLLLLSSLGLLASIDFHFVIVLLVVILTSWWCSKNINKRTMYLGIIANIVILGYFKYTNFFIETFSHVLGIDDYVVLHLMLPLGISFYVFSAISYIVDVYKSKIVARNLLDVALYLAFFPKLTSGPIQRSGDFFKQIDIPRNISWDNFNTGIQIFTFGLFKKLVLADRLSVFVNQVYGAPEAFNGITIFMAAIAYTMQIYFDFSGYTDMAIGVARILDIKLPTNFNLPYMAHNVTEFWKRWHITLSSWLMDYIYIPLGGNRKGVIRTYVNLLLTMLIGGLWHGAQWTYIIWGAMHGVALAIHKMWVSSTHSNIQEHSLIRDIVSIVITFLFVSLCWIFFRAENISQALAIISGIVTLKVGIFHPYIWLPFSLIVYFIALIFAARHSERNLGVKNKNNSWLNGYYPMQNLNSFKGLVVFFVFVGIILGLAYTGGSPFIYGAY